MAPFSDKKLLATIVVSHEQSGMRIDRFLAQEGSYSRSFIQKLIDARLIILNNQIVDSYSKLVKQDDMLILYAPVEREAVVQVIPIAQLPHVPVIFEHDDFLIIEKPAGLIVHPPHDQFSGVCLSDWLVATYPDLKGVGLATRPGIVHRLDKDTSGLMIIPRTSAAHATCAGLFKDRHIHKTYLALVSGQPPQTAQVNYSIDRHPTDPTRMTHRLYGGRSALTTLQVLQRYPDAALIKAEPLTGRTHQIRVHCLALGHPLLGDTLYGSASNVIARQALHAHQLSFSWHGEPFTFTSELPADMARACQQLQEKQ
jgi:23S rRNA pseudouridine1911/1915/1917 synthase